jgi:hypothetical protein
MGGTYTSHAEMRNAYKIMVQIDDKMIMITYSLTPWCRIFFEKLTVSQLVKQPTFFMEPKGSLLSSQKPAPGPYPEPAESSSPHRSLSP